MKQIVHKSMVAHLFANQSQDYAATPTRNFYFYGNKCNSYGNHFVAAMHHGDTVLLNAENYSVTTASHMSELRGACSHLQTFDVVNPSADSKADHRRNFKAMVENYENEIFRASRARIYNSLDTAERMLTNANAYAIRFKIGSRVKAIDTTAIVAKLATRNARENAATRREMKARAKREAALLAEREEKQAENLAKWRNGELSCYHLPLRHSAPVALRLTSDGETVQTTQGVEFPTADAKRYMPVVLRAFKMVRDYVYSPGTEPMRLGQFAINRIDAEKGLLIAGCHTVTRQEIDLLSVLIAA